MNSFQLYLTLGFQHIINIHGYDHIVFVLTLCAAYSFSEIKKVLILVTAFTIGHSVTLALSTLNYVLIPAPVIEFLIPVTIFITAVSNLFPAKEGRQKLIYIIALVFGLVHGLGFSNYLKELLGAETSIVQPLFAFNVGLEIGQIVILSVYFLILGLALKLFRVKHHIWRIFISGAAAGIALTLIIQNKFWG
ncbi:HupE/UreJ family protein [Maribellus maritimus]|uniref:HupE/UreJ family protein n=1 Tax=Maribellus maritimus TaxID=2870838 RepID=UPI001EEC52A5|nr:HupE/UreJ family protein [Maribellus maritimus]MCG6188532.1 HupE/UreJ family protein [Maribellus maritimus]